MKYSFIFLIFLCCSPAAGQIIGKVSDNNGEALPYVNIYLEDHFTGTTTNDQGIYELEISEPGKYTVHFQYLGYKTEKKEIFVDSFPFVLDVSLEQESTSLEEVILRSGENPANRIMRKAIEKREFHKEKIDAYTADFYSRGIWRIENAPERILGQEIGDLGGGLDSTRSGIIYLSETISKIKYKAPDHFEEKIIASKVSGNDNGFSLNSARDATISFYNNTIALNSEIISPLAGYAFEYYDFKLNGAFYNDRGNLINKIEVMPKRPNDRVFNGYIYIVEDSWQIYGLELKTTGKAMQVPPIEELVFTQNFNYSEEEQLWVPISQTVDFEFGMFGISGNGRFTAVYTNYDFSPEFGKREFSNEILSFAPKANEKDSIFWIKSRPVPLTLEEKVDYSRKDSIQEHRNSRTYLDSIDQVRNEFGISNLLTGYSYTNSHENWALSFSSPLLHTNVNTVQGYNTSLKISFLKSTSENYESYWRIFSDMAYGFSEERFRVSGGFQKKFNNISKPVLTFSGGSTVKQINNLEPITESINGIGTNFFERNYLKLYDLLFLETSYQEELFNGFRFSSSLSLEKRSPLYNNWNSAWVNREEITFTSNNPLEPFNYNSAPFEEHHIFKFSLSGIVHFGQKYYSYPDGKYNLPNDNPVLFFSYEKGLGSNLSDYNFDQFQVGLKQAFRIGNKGEFGYNLVGGTFFGDDVVSYPDYRHFRGNQTRVGLSSTYLGSFNLLPYYALSTKENYALVHVEHNFEGWVLGKIPLINRLNYDLVLGAHRLMAEGNSPYSEYSIGLDNLGFGKFRFLRLDYVLSNFQGKWENGFIFGLEFLQAFLR